MTTALVLALLILAFAWLARSDGRNLALTGALGLVVTFLSLPFVDVLGARSDQSLAMTPLALTPVSGQLWLAPLLALASLLIGLRLAPRGLGALLAATGAVGLAVAFAFAYGPDRFLVQRPVPGVLEALFPLVLLAVMLVLALSQSPRSRRGALLAAVILPLGLAAFLFAPLGAQIFPQLRGYYQVAGPLSASQAALVTRDWALDVPDYLQADIGKRGQDWQAILKALSSPAAGTVRAKQRRDYYSVQGEYYQRRRTPGDTTPLPATLAVPAEMPPGYPPGQDSSNAGVRRAIARAGEYGLSSWVFFAALALGGGLLLALRGLRIAVTDGPTLPGRSRLWWDDLRGAGILALTSVVIAAGFHSTGFNVRDLLVNLPWIADFFTRSFPPDWSFLSDTMREMLITVNIALIGTVVAAVLALPLSLLAARTLTDNTPLTRALYFLTRTFFNVDRGVDTLILALILVAAVGLGPFAGALAMAIHSVADLGKLYSEAIENADRGPIEALESSGAPGTSVVRWGLLPQVLPLFLSYTLYRFEINFRVSIVLGFVGAGGIGFLVNETMRGAQYPKAALAIILIVLVVNLIDFLSAAVRRRLV
ncbi:MAG: phosphonate ABC transporter, permease protein PhnE [Deinococcus sp.]